jgi:hypothetical protein
MPINRRASRHKGQRIAAALTLAIFLLFLLLRRGRLW